MNDHVNIQHPDSYRRMVEEKSEIEALKVRIKILEQANAGLSSNLDAIFNRIARGDQVELHYPDGSVVLITKARKRNAGEAD